MRNYSSCINISNRTRTFALTLFLLILYLFHVDLGQAGLSQWSPESSAYASSPSERNGRIAFARFSDDAPDVFVINPEGTNQVNLTNDRNPDSSPAWSPDGAKIAFAKYVIGVGWNIYAMNANGNNLTQLTFNAAQFDIRLDNPTWSPDGTMIAFVVTLHGALSSLYVMNADGSDRRLINSGFYYRKPAWSPDGTRIAFEGRPTATLGQLVNYAFVINADGSGRTQVADNLWPFSGPVWSPDGSKLLYARLDNPEDRFKSSSNLYLVDAAGGVPTQLTSTKALDTDPVWSPDGNLIAFNTDRNRIMCIPGAAPCLEIYLMNADGSNQSRIANEPVLGTVSDWQSLVPKQQLPLAPATVQFGGPRYRVPEGGGLIDEVRVTRLGDLSREATVNYSSADGTASERADYTAVFGSLRFATGEAEKMISIPITDDAYVEADETINLTLSNPMGGTLGGSRTAVLTITDNDTAQPTTNPIDDARVFVRQHYLDFLNREPDQGGYDYWTSQITQCGSDALCGRQRRMAVSAAFFIEQEFQNTGSFVYRFYKGSLGRQPRYAEFVPDRSRVVVGPNLEANKIAFAEGWTQRAEFIQKYPASLSQSEFVDALLQRLKDTSGVDLSNMRQTYIDQLQAGATRGQVVRAVVDERAFVQAEFNRTFVLMEYFGYLKRDPDQAGYDFWLDVLNNKVPGNFRSMVCAFITSAEYQQRFSPIVTRSDSECGP